MKILDIEIFSGSLGCIAFQTSLEGTMNMNSADLAYLIALERQEEMLDYTRPLSAPWRGLLDQLRGTLGR